MTIYERDIEKHLIHLVKERGGMVLKFTSSLAGVPDRIVLFKGQTYFVELKRPDGHISVIQEVMMRRMTAEGAKVYVLWSKGEVDWFAEEVLK